MSMTFGAATSDKVHFGVGQTIAGTVRMSLVAGWFRPTTLTAGRGYWGCNGTIGAEVGGTTSEIVLRTQNATQSGVWTTSGAGIVVDEWVFLAFFGSFLNTASVWRVWKGTIDTSPVQVGGLTTPTTAPSGNLTGNATIAFGNRGSAATAAFIGDIGNCFVIQQSGSVSNIPGPMGLWSNYGSINANEELGLLTRYVQPMWQGRFIPESAFDNSYAGGGNWFCFCLPLDATPVGSHRVQVFSSGAASTTLLGTISGAVSSSLRSPISRLSVQHVTREFIPARW